MFFDKVTVRQQVKPLARLGVRLNLWLVCAMLIFVPLHSYAHSVYPDQRLLAYQPPNTGIDGMNLLFVIDQSGSMGGTRYDGDPRYGEGSDLYDMRFLGPQYALDVMSRFVDTRLPEEMPTINVGLVAFGDASRQILDWTNVRKNYATVDEWTALIPQIKEDMSNERFRDTNGTLTNMGYTNFLEAMAEAKILFQQAPVPEIGQQYLSAIVLLTDGAPCISTVDCGDFGVSSYAVNHLLQLRTYVQTNFPGLELFVINFDANNEFYPSLETYWRDVVCASTDCDPIRLQLVQTTEDLSQHFNTVLGYLFNKVSPGVSNSVVCSPQQPFYVPPYSQFLRVNIFKSSNAPLDSNAVQIFQPDGSLFNVTVQGLDTPIEVREVSLPQPGNWQFTVLDESIISEINCVADLINASGRMAVENLANADASNLSVDMHDSVDMLLQIVDKFDNPLPVYENAYALKVKAYIFDALPSDPATAQQIAEFDMSLDPTLVNVNQFVGSWVPTVPGEYEVRVDASFINDAGIEEWLLQGVRVFDSFTVREIAFENQAPPRSSIREGEAIALQTQVLVKETGQPVLWTTDRFVTQVTVTNQADNSLVVPPTVYPNESTGIAGQVSATLSDLPSGQYDIQVEVGEVDASGLFIPLDVDPGKYPLEVRQVNPIEVVMSLDPNEEKVEAQKWGLVDDLPFLWSNEDLRVQVEIRNTLDNSPVSLSSISGGTLAVPNLTMTEGDKNTNYTERLREISPGIYSLVIEKLGTGDYRFVATANLPNEQLVGDYLWQNNTGSLAQTRILNPWIRVVAVAAPLALVVLGVLAWRGYRVYKINKRLPKIMGSVTPFFITYDGTPQPLPTYHLGQRQRHRIPLKGKDAYPFRKIVFRAAAFSPEDLTASNKFNVVVEEIVTVDKTKLTPSLTLKQDGEFNRIEGSQVPGKGYYALYKDYMESNLSSFGTDDMENMF